MYVLTVYISIVWQYFTSYLYVLQVFDKVLSELEPVCLAEQDFCCKFFHLLSEVQPAPLQVMYTLMHVSKQWKNNVQNDDQEPKHYSICDIETVLAYFWL